MALYPASGFTGFIDSYAVPAGSSDVMFTGSVDLILSAGITQQVFGTLSTALKCIHFMEQQRLYSLSPNEDATIINLRSKLLILENNHINQEMMNSYVLLVMEIKFKQFIGLWLTWFLFQRHLLLSDFVVLGCHGLLIQALLKWRLAGLIKTDLVFKLSIMFINRLPYPIRILLIQVLLLFQVSKYSKNKII